MPVPKENCPRDVLPRIRQWADEQGYEFQLSPHASEFTKVTVRHPNGEYATTVIPNAHHGRRLRRHQVRYVVQEIDDDWRN